MSNTWLVLASIEFAGLAIFTAFLLRYFAAKGAHPLALATVFVSWCVLMLLIAAAPCTRFAWPPTRDRAVSHRRYFGFFGTLFLPIDIAEAYWSIYENVTNATQVRTLVSVSLPAVCGPAAARCITWPCPRRPRRSMDPTSG